MKVAINKCWGGFSVSEEVYKELGIKWDDYGHLSNEDFGIKDDNYNAYRSDKKLIAAIEKVGLEKASGELARIVIVNVPKDISWELDNYDGMESIHEQHRVW